MQFENEVHKCRVKQMQSHIEILERKVEYYVEQQSMFMMMNGDLEKYKKVFDMSVEAETMYSPFTPNNQYAPDKLVQLARRGDIIDIEKVMGDTKEQYAALELQIKE